MPRPKKPGAPEPKKRSRNGCWPCKTRKVKCDEGRPSCVNCQKQSEPCDYSIRLNWEGRGKKKAEGSAGSGQINFSSGMINVGTNKLATGDEESLSPINRSEFHGRFTSSASTMSIPAVGLSQMSEDAPGALDSAQSLCPPTSAPKNQSFVTDMSMIDPALMGQPGSSSYQDHLFNDVRNRPDYQYTQSYERYHAGAPNTPLSAQPPALSRLRDAHIQDDPQASPADSGIRSPSVGTFSNRSATMPYLDSPTSTPPFFGSARDDLEISGSERTPQERPKKRPRYDQEVSLPYTSAMPPPTSTSFPTSFSTYSTDFQETASVSTLPGLVDAPATPASTHSDEAYKTRPSPRAVAEAPDLRRLSVNSLLSGPPGMPSKSDHGYISSNSDAQSWPPQLQDETTTWGVDRGFKDLDIGKNDDMNALLGSSPTTRDHLDLALDEDGDLQPAEFGFGMQTNETAFESGGYYDKPVPVSIPRILEPLPNKLLENPMNLLYFHHFLNHTAGCLIPHNCSSNPFKSILPQMAVRDDNLLNLLLAYSASHRARLLRQPEPATRIALWVQDIFPNLRHALNDPNKIISNATLATAVMLASLEIISPKAFGVAVPWQKHLDTARQMIAARGGPQRMQTSRGDKVSSFLWSWFAYLDVLGSFSGGKTNSSSSAWILDYDIDEEDDYQIDCILGFTSQCVRILAKIAELARLCDTKRIGPDLTIRQDWQPEDEVVARAETLENDLHESRMHPAKPCTHMQSKDEAAYQWDSLEMAATNEAFHWAGIVHLHRRVLGKPSTHKDVQTAVREILGALYKVRPGSSAEACLLFPMFTAGCDTQNEGKKAYVLERIKSVERFGMTQVHQARTLMERVWETGKPWETLVAGEFFG